MLATLPGIIAFLGAIYALFTKQGKLALGLLIISISFIFVIPDLVGGIWVNVFDALAMIIFAAGVLVMVFRKKTVESPNAPKDEEN